MALWVIAKCSMVSTCPIPISSINDSDARESAQIDCFLCTSVPDNIGEHVGVSGVFILRCIVEGYAI